MKLLFLYSIEKNLGERAILLHIIVNVDWNRTFLGFLPLHGTIAQVDHIQHYTHG